MISQSPVLNRQQAQEGSQDVNSREFGDSISNNKSNDVIRIAFQNVRGFGTEAKNPRTIAIKKFIDSNDIDAMAFAEVNVNWTNLRKHNTIESIAREWYEYSKTSVSYNSHAKEKGDYLPGGVATITNGQLALRASKPDNDDRYLGRWSSQVYQGKQGITTRLVAVYVPIVAKDHGCKKVFCQQQKALLQMRISGAVISTFWQDFWDQIDKWLEAGDQLIIGGDWNTQVTNPAFLEKFSEHNLLPAMQSKHGKSLPPTYNNGSKAINEIFISSTLQITNVGYAQFGSTMGDHRPVWLDVTKATALGANLHRPTSRKARRLRCKDPRVVERYNQLL